MPANRLVHSPREDRGRCKGESDLEKRIVHKDHSHRRRESRSRTVERAEIESVKQRAEREEKRTLLQILT